MSSREDTPRTSSGIKPRRKNLTTPSGLLHMRSSSHEISSSSGSDIGSRRDRRRRARDGGSSKLRRNNGRRKRHARSRSPKSSRRRDRRSSKKAGGKPSTVASSSPSSSSSSSRGQECVGGKVGASRLSVSGDGFSSKPRSTSLRSSPASSVSLDLPSTGGGGDDVLLPTKSPLMMDESSEEDEEEDSGNRVTIATFSDEDIFSKSASTRIRALSVRGDSDLRLIATRLAVTERKVQDQESLINVLLLQNGRLQHMLEQQEARLSQLEQGDPHRSKRGRLLNAIITTGTPQRKENSSKERILTSAWRDSRGRRSHPQLLEYADDVGASPPSTPQVSITLPQGREKEKDKTRAYKPKLRGIEAKKRGHRRSVSTDVRSRTSKPLPAGPSPTFTADTHIPAAGGAGAGAGGSSRGGRRSLGSSHSHQATNLFSHSADEAQGLQKLKRASKKDPSQSKRTHKDNSKDALAHSDGTDGGCSVAVGRHYSSDAQLSGDGPSTPINDHRHNPLVHSMAREHSSSSSPLALSNAYAGAGGDGGGWMGADERAAVHASLRDSVRDMFAPESLSNIDVSNFVDRYVNYQRGSIGHIDDAEVLGRMLFNFRDIADASRGCSTLSIASGKVYRSSCLSRGNPSEDDLIKTLVWLRDVRKIKTIIDFRDRNEKRAVTRDEILIDREFPTVRYGSTRCPRRFWIPMYNTGVKMKGLFWNSTSKRTKASLFRKAIKSGKDGVEKQFSSTVMSEVGLDGLNKMMLKYAGEEIRQCLRICSDAENYPIMFHCSSGKDRTGLIAMLIQKVLGLDHESIMSDYVRSEHELRNVRHLIVEENSAKGLPEVFADTPASVMEETIDYISEKHESFAGYFNEIGFTREDQRMMTSNLLEL